MECNTRSSGEGEQAGGNDFIVTVTGSRGKCPAGEKRGDDNRRRGVIPVLSCEGACIRGEIARLTANILSKQDGYGRGCHGELVTVPDSAIARWIKEADTVVVVDGCFLKCHERIFKNILDKSKLRSYDALSYYGKYTEFFDADAVSEEERKEIANDIAGKILQNLRNEDKNEANLRGLCV